MKRTKIAELYASAESHIGKEVCVKGWVRTHRGNKYVQFVALNDGSTIKNLQVVFDMNNFTDEQLKPLTTGSAMSVTGLLVESQAKGSQLKSRLASLKYTALPTLRHIPCRKKAIRLNSCVR